MNQYRLFVAASVAVGVALFAWIVMTTGVQRNPLDGGNGTEYGSGGAAIDAQSGKPGIPGCDGGTNPRADGKFYIAGTKQECNPSDEDRQKLTNR